MLVVVFFCEISLSIYIYILPSPFAGDVFVNFNCPVSVFMSKTVDGSKLKYGNDGNKRRLHELDGLQSNEKLKVPPSGSRTAYLYGVPTVLPELIPLVKKIVLFSTPCVYTGRSFTFLIWISTVAVSYREYLNYVHKQVVLLDLKGLVSCSSTIDISRF